MYSVVPVAGSEVIFLTIDHKQSKGLRILIYSQDGYGLGHLRRTGLIAEKLLELHPDSTVLTLSDSPLKQFFKLPVKHTYIKLPTIIKKAPGVWRPVNPSLEINEVFSIRRKLISTSISTFQPQLILVDHMPHGAMGELLPHLQYLKRKCLNARIVLGLRDILDAPEVICKRWKAEGAYNAVAHYYDLVLVYGQQEIYDLSEQYQFPWHVKERVRYCGYICNPDHLDRHENAIRATYLAQTGPGTKLMIAMAGGGADGYPVMRTLIEALPVVLKRFSIVLVLITGPFQPADLRQQLKAQAQFLPVHVLPAVRESADYLQAADLVVAMAGYNTTAEILSSGKPAILIPRSGPSAEQRTRSRLFMEQKWVTMIEPSELSKDRVAAAVIQSLTEEEKKCGDNQPDLNGLSTAVHHLQALLTESLN